MDVLPLPHKRETGATPPEEDAVHMMLEAEAEPAHEADKGVSANATIKDDIASIEPMPDAIHTRDFIAISNFVLIDNACKRRSSRRV